ncbi:hypothetical protein SAMN02745116_02625 [Pilibacter termitis]|uniref:Uncharacterized protein n=1 Tax=Pilibacter termitis TaxID=263852 RepID=A0A1T4RJW6_9ENTE|nr:hypothetical protein [Pilibacter termitis]SKA16038.1 hypothetical protein SAMN02745116_02625 [Pilibacter termitis]
MEQEQFLKWIKENLLSTGESIKLSGKSAATFKKAVVQNSIKPFYESSDEGRGKVRLYLKSDVERYSTVKAGRKKKKK